MRPERNGNGVPAIGRLVTLGLFAGLAVLGLALGAHSQKEFVLESDLQAQGELASQGAAGNLVILTAVPVAVGVAVAALLLSRVPPLRRTGLAGLLAVATYAAVLLGQSMWPFYVAVVEYRYATLTNSLLAANLDAVPSVALPPLALLLGTVLLGGHALGRLFAPEAPGDARVLLRRQAAAALLATPFLAMVAWGNLRVLLDLPDDQPGLGPYFAVLPGIVLACLALAALALAKTWALGTYVRNARLGAAVQDSWHTLGRLEASVLALLAAFALAASFLAATPLEDLELGRVLGFTLRSHTQAVVLLAIPLLPLLALQRPVARHLAAEPLHAVTLDDATDPVARAAVAAGVLATAGAALGTWAVPAALWAWLLAVAPAALAAAILARPRDAAPHALLAAFLFWAIGNTVRATYAGGEGSAVLSFVTPPGLLALLRTLGAVLAAAALGRLVLGLAPGRRPASVAIAAGAGAAAAATLLLEVPLTAWLLNRPGVDAIAVGSVVASLDPPVRAILHTIATVLAVASALLVALLHRPEWFGRRPGKPVAVVRPKARRTRTPNAADEAADGTRAGAPPRRTPA